MSYHTQNYRQMLSLRAPRRGSRSSPRGGGGGSVQTVLRCVCAPRRTPPPKNTLSHNLSFSQKKDGSVPPPPRPTETRACHADEGGLVRQK